MNDLERADRAKELLENPTFREVQAEIRAELIAAVESVAITDVERLQEMVLALQVHNRHRKKLERWIADGKVEKSKLDQENWIERARQRFVG
jgi:hypothetical protein